MSTFPPNIEIVADPSPAPPVYWPLKPWHRSQRFLVFIAVFTLTAAVSLLYLYSRPALYRSSAMLLTSAMTAIDKEASIADAQKVAIQKQVLLSRELLEATLTRLAEKKPAAQTALTPAELENLLTVTPVPNTNLVEVSAQGSDPELLPLLINAWIDVYLDADKKRIHEQTSETSRHIQDELDGLEHKVSAKRDELEHFRMRNEILSSGRDENRALAMLKGLNDSLNRANEESVKARANLEAIKLAIQDGQTVVPEQDQGTLQNLERRKQELKEKQSKLAAQYTQDYIDLQPAMKVIPEEIEKIEKEIKKIKIFGKNFMLSEAKKNYAASLQTIKSLEAQIESHKKQTADFTSRFSKYETMQADLEGLEKLYRETQERLVQIQTSFKEKYPQVTVINRAFEPDKPIWPHYHRDAVIALACSLFLGLFSAWMVEYLVKKPEPAPAPIILAGISLAGRTGDLRRVADQAPSAGDLPNPRANRSESAAEQKPAPLLQEPSPRELSRHELELLLHNTSLKGKQQIACLLSGLSPAEIAALKAGDIDPDSSYLLADGRTVPFNAALKALFEQSGGVPAWQIETLNAAAELKATLYFAAVDSGLAHPEEITAEAIRHSYIAYLIRQGLRLSDLEQLVGQLDPALMLVYGGYSPPERGLPLTAVDVIHPALLNAA